MNLHIFRRPTVLTTMAVALVACHATAPAASEQSSTKGSPTSSSTATSTQAPGQGPIKVIALKTLPELHTIIPLLAGKQVVFIGETHDRFEHHLAQLEIIRALYAHRPELVIGVEYFQVRFQPALDAYIAGHSSEKQLLRKTEYFQRWRFDYRLYRPIMQFARAQGIPVIALNIPTEISEKVARSGIDSLSDSEKTQLPGEIDRSDIAYRERLRAVFDAHRESGTAPGNLDNFVDAQLLWDEAMAETAAAYLRGHPQRPMVILAGNGHLLYGAGIPRRLLRRVPVTSGIVVNADGINDPEMADFLLFPPNAELPPAGLLGVLVRQKAQDLIIDGLSADGGAMQAGLKKDDVLLALDGERVSTLADVKLALLDKLAGERVKVTFRRVRNSGAAKIRDVEVVLTASH